MVGRDAEQHPCRSGEALDMGEDKATRWRRMSREQRERLMSVVAAIQTGLDELDSELLDGAGSCRRSCQNEKTQGIYFSMTY